MKVLSHGHYCDVKTLRTGLFEKRVKVAVISGTGKGCKSQCSSTSLPELESSTAQEEAGAEHICATSGTS